MRQGVLDQFRLSSAEAALVPPEFFHGGLQRVELQAAAVGFPILDQSGSCSMLQLC